MVSEAIDFPITVSNLICHGLFVSLLELENGSVDFLHPSFHSSPFGDAGNTYSKGKKNFHPIGAFIMLRM